MRLVGMVLFAALLIGSAACQSTHVQIPTAPIAPDEKSLGPTWGDHVGLDAVRIHPDSTKRPVRRGLQ